MSKGWVRCQVGNFLLENEWDVEPGSVLVLFGPSGTGKTMTLRAIAGLAAPQDGKIEVGGQVVYDHAAGAWLPPPLRRVGYMPQDYLLFPHLDIAGNIAFGLHNLDPVSRAHRVSQLVEALQLGGLERRRVWELSGGQRQRAALARAMAPRPAVLLLDEPFSALDMELRRTVRGELRAVLKAARVPVVLVTHDREEALALGDAVQVMEQGRTIASGEPVRVLGHPPQARVARLVGVENLLRLAVRAVDTQAGVTVCERNGTSLEIPLVNARIGEEITVGIRADDIILASEEPRGLSARNRLPGRVASVEPWRAGYEVTLDCGFPLRCHVTQGALRELGITPGKAVWAVVKASSCFVVGD